MTPKKLLLVSLFLLLSCFQTYAYNYFFVQDPQFWQQDQGSIEEAQFTIHPRGLYMEVGMYLTLSAKDTWITDSGRGLEVVLGFDLPENAIVTDSWLWINQDIVRADIKDRWSAATIYNDIVGRRQDPSILYKYDSNQYELRVFPLQSDSTRRVKITYLVPGNWSDGQVSIPLPVDLLKSSKNPIKKIQVQSFLNNNFSNPRITQLEKSTFKSTSHATLGQHFILDLDYKQLGGSIDFVLDAPMKDGVFLGRYEGETENYYQLAILPSKVLQLEAANPKKVMVLVDYHIVGGTTSKSELLSTLETQLIQALNAKDSFNILLSQTNIAPLKQEWLPGDKETISNYFKSLKSQPLANYSNLPNLLVKGIEYIQKQGTGGSLLFFSNAGQVGEPATANVLIEELRTLMGENIIPIYVADYANENLNYYNVNGITYHGNEYFYTNITKLTKGALHRILQNNNLAATLQKTFSSVAALHGILDIHTGLNEGFCYGRYTLNESKNIATINQPFLQVGKYQGDFPFEIEASGVINNQFLGKQITVPLQNTLVGSEMDAVIWAGNHIQNLEKEARDNTTINEIIEWSLANRVLSLYTAFLALEVAQGGVVCTDCIDETNLILSVVDTENNGNSGATTNDPLTNIPIRDEGGIATDDVKNGGGAPEGAPGLPVDEPVTATNEVALDTLLNIQASPNPFSEQTIITVQLGKDVDTEQLAFSIYGLDGRKVKTFVPANLNAERLYQLSWNGTDERGNILAKGVYIFNIKTKSGQKNLKLLFIK